MGKKLPSLTISLNLRDQGIIRRISGISSSYVSANKTKQQVQPVTKNETIRRGLHSFRYLYEIDEKVLLDLLSKYLHSALRVATKENVSNAKDISLAIYAVMIAKYGILKAEPFENIPMALQFLLQTRFEKHNLGGSKKIDQNFGKTIRQLSMTVDKVFLKA